MSTEFYTIYLFIIICSLLCYVPSTQFCGICYFIVILFFLWFVTHDIIKGQVSIFSLYVVDCYNIAPLYAESECCRHLPCLAQVALIFDGYSSLSNRYTQRFCMQVESPNTHTHTFDNVLPLRFTVTYLIELLNYLRMVYMPKA